MSVESTKRKSRTNWLWISINIGISLLLLLTYLCAHIPPRSLGYLALLGLAYPVTLIVNLLFIFFWLLRKRLRNAWISVLAVCIGLNHFSDYLQLNFSTALQEGKTQVRLLTWNVQLFGFYEWEDNVRKRNAMFDVLTEEKADILCFQEFYHSDERNLFPTRDTLIKFLPTGYYHERYTHSPRHDQYFGVIIFSRFPIVSKGEIPFENDANNFCIYADLKIKEDTVRVYNAHLQSIRFGREDYAFVQENQNNEELKKGAFRIAGKLKRAFYNRQNQVDRIAGHIERSPHRVILCGDFNDPPLSYTYENFTDLLNDSFVEMGQGTGNTLNKTAFPTLRIDYVMHSDSIQTLGYRTLHEDLSDHFPVVVDLGI